MESSMLFFTTVPILLGDKRAAGRLSARLYRRHGVVSHWFGEGHSMSLSIYAQKHPTSLPLDGSCDESWIRWLCAFAKEQSYTGGIVCLIPCCETSEAFLQRMACSLEERFVLLPRPRRGEDPLLALLHTHASVPSRKEDI